MVETLAGCRIAVPETRELDRLSRMLEEHGATVLRCPLVTIHDVPDPTPVEAWIRRFVEAPFDDLVLLTGEGVRRLHGVARRAGLEAPFLTALRQTRKISRGPKPGQALREFGMNTDIRAERPTTAGVIATLSAYDLRGRIVGLQLYPDIPDPTLVEFLVAAGATPVPVLPYVYTANADDTRVVELIDEMSSGRVDVIAFTSSPQVRRLFDVATAANREAELHRALRSTTIAAVGPVVAAELQRRGLGVTVMPTDTYFMKPLVSAIEAANQDPDRVGSR
jgi:uroporphyrinogen-III synthase